MIKISRRKSRKRAITLLYQSDLMGKDIETIIQNEQLLGIEVDDFTKELATGVYSKRKDLNAIIEGVVKNWTLDRIAIIDLNILRVAVFEMYYLEDIPLKVSVDEAIEIAKILGQKDDTPKFINGILGKILTNLTSKDK